MSRSRGRADTRAQRERAIGRERRKAEQWAAGGAGEDDKEWIEWRARTQLRTQCSCFMCANGKHEGKHYKEKIADMNEHEQRRELNEGGV